MAGLQDIRRAIAGALQGVTGGGWFALSGRVRSGFAPYGSTGAGLLSDSNTGAGSGALVSIGAGACVDDDEEHANRYPVFRVDVNAWMAVPKDEASDLSSVLGFIESARHAVDAALPRGGTVFNPPDIISRGRNTVFQFTLNCIARGCDAPLARNLLNESDVFVRNELDLEIYV